jgi:hypothetical protein
VSSSEVRQDLSKEHADDAPVPTGTGASFRAHLWTAKLAVSDEACAIKMPKSYSVVFISLANKDRAWNDFPPDS